MAVQSQFYSVDGNSKTFPSTKHIGTKAHMAVWLQRVVDGVYIEVNIGNYELINNSAVLTEAPHTELYQKMEIRVADSPNELLNSPSDIAIVSEMRDEIIAVADIADEIAEVASEPLKQAILDAEGNALSTSASAAASAISASEAEASALSASDSETASAISASEALVSQTSASASEASATISANDAQLRAWEAEAEEMTAQSYAVEPEDILVKEYESNSDGTFTATDTSEYSALHHASKIAGDIGVITDNIEVINTQLITNNGFNRHNLDTLGVVEFCHSVSAGVVHQYKNILGRITFTELTGQTHFANGTSFETPLADRTMTIYPKDGQASFDVYLNNTKTEYLVLQSVQALLTSGTCWFYFSGETGLLTATTAELATEDIIKDCAIVGIAYQNATKGKCLFSANEQHGIAMSGDNHAWGHFGFGALYKDGLSINGLAEGSGSYTSFDSGTILDEDIDNYSGIQTIAPFWFKETVNAEWDSIDADLLLGYIESGNTRPSYNNYNSGDYILTEMSNNSYILVHFIRSNGGKYPMVKVIGENEYNTATIARAAAEHEISNINRNGLPTPETLDCYSVIIDSNGNTIAQEDGSLKMDWRTNKSVSSDSGGTTDHLNLLNIGTLTHAELETELATKADLNEAQIFTAPQKATITAEDNTINFSLTNNFYVTASATTMNGIGMTSGQSGTIVIVDASNITGWGTEFKWADTIPDLTGVTTAVFGYFCLNDTTIYIGMVK